MTKLISDRFEKEQNYIINQKYNR